MTQTAAGCVVKINQKVPAQDQIESTQVGQRQGQVEATEFDHAAEGGIDDPASVLLSKESVPLKSSHASIEFRRGISSLAGRGERFA